GDDKKRAMGWPGGRFDRAISVAASHLHHRLEPSPEHALAVERELLGVHHVGEALVLHHLGVYAVAVLARLVDDEREPDHLAGLELHALRERGALARLHIVGHALDIFERAMLAPDLAGPFGHLAIGGDIALRHGDDETIDITGHGRFPLRCEGNRSRGVGEKIGLKHGGHRGHGEGTGCAPRVRKKYSRWPPCFTLLCFPRLGDFCELVTTAPDASREGRASAQGSSRANISRGRNILQPPARPAAARPRAASMP